MDDLVNGLRFAYENEKGKERKINVVQPSSTDYRITKFREIIAITVIVKFKVANDDATERYSMSRSTRVPERGL